MKTRLAIICLAIATTNAAWAHPNHRTMNLEQVFQLATHNDPKYKQDTYDYQAQRQTLPIARAAYLPAVNIGGTVSSTTAGGVHTTPNTITATVTQQIFNLNALQLIRQASSSTRAAEATFKANQQALIAREVSAYMKVLNDARSVQTLQTQNKALEEASDIQAIKQKTGEGTIQEAAQAKADLEQSQASTIAAKTQLAIDKRALYSLTDRDNQPYQATGYNLMDVEDFDLTKNTAPALSSIFNPNEDILAPANQADWNRYKDNQIALTQHQNPSLLAQQYAAKAAQQGLTAQTSQWIPSISANASYGNGNTNIGTTNRTDTTSAGLTLTFTPFAGGGMIAKRKQLASQYKSALASLSQIHRATLNTTRQELDMLQAQNQKIKADMQSIISSNEAYNVEKETYENGLSNQLELLKSISSRTTATNNYYQDIYTFMQAYVLLKQASGTLNVNDLKTLDTLLKNPAQA